MGYKTHTISEYSCDLCGRTTNDRTDFAYLYQERYSNYSTGKQYLSVMICEPCQDSPVTKILDYFKRRLSV